MTSQKLPVVSRDAFNLIYHAGKTSGIESVQPEINQLNLDVQQEIISRNDAERQKRVTEKAYVEKSKALRQTESELYWAKLKLDDANSHIRTLIVVLIVFACIIFAAAALSGKSRLAAEKLSEENDRLTQQVIDLRKVTNQSGLVFGALIGEDAIGENK